MPTSPTLPTLLRGLAGGLAALALLEIALRVLVTPGTPPEPSIHRDALYAPSVIARQIEEGIGVARFTPAGARLTGNSPLPDAPSVVILGDSYVAAREVADAETMGAQLERMVRRSGRALNVRQYGWRGASPAQYLLVAREVLAQWNPEHVVVVLSSDDLDARTLRGDYPRLHILEDGDAEAIDDPARSREAASFVVRHSALAFQARRRWQQLADRAPEPVRPLLGGRTHGWDAPDELLVAAVPRAVVVSLARTFGERLTIVYVADVRVSGGETADALEGALLTQCELRRVRCVSTRPAMLEVRRFGLVARGFPTTTLGVGHLNAIGHWLVAESVWRVIRGEPQVATAATVSPVSRTR